jgi:protein BCP1
MPTEVVPPMYKMLNDEIKNAIENKEPFEFDHYLIVSRAFTEEESLLDKEDEQPNKKKKRIHGSSTRKEVFYFHPEDEIFHEKALQRISYDYTVQNQDSDSRRTFQDYGIFPKGHLILIKSDDIPELVERMQQAFPPF